MKVVLWDYTGISAAWAEKFLKEDVEIIRTLKPYDKDQAEFILNSKWDYVLIFEQDSREIFEEILNTMREMNFPTENIIFAQDTLSWLKNSAAIYLLIDSNKNDLVHRGLNFFNQKKWHKYTSVTAEGLSYVATSKDNIIIASMYLTNENYAADNMKIFHALAKKYYKVNDSTGYFLDLGANIGTTGIYFTSKLAPNLKLLAFEPDVENFKLLRVNLILNDMENKAIAVNCGLGENFDEMTMYRNLENPGGNSVTPYEEGMPTETIKIIPLDTYLAENNISAREVKYIWIDTEGFEAQVLLGARNLLMKNPAPVFMEFNPTMWNKSGQYEEMITLLKAAGYTHWIWIPELLQSGVEKLYPIDHLWTWQNSNYVLSSLGDIFLLKRF
jgi:FkbM family methyltransferase